MAFVNEQAEAMDAYKNGHLVWRGASQQANAHIEVAVAHGADGRIVGASTSRGHSLTAIGSIDVKIPGAGPYTVNVHIDPSTWMRHDPINGKRYGEPVEVVLQTVKFEPGRKPSPDAQPRGGDAPYVGG